MKFNNVYVKETATLSGNLEFQGPYGKYFDKHFDNYYLDKSFELSEIKLQEETINELLKKAKTKSTDINLLIGGDLSNQIVASSYGAKNTNIPFLGVYNACATSSEEMIIAANMIESKQIKNAICVTSSHNLAAEKQFRNPVEYGAPKPKTATFTATGGAAIMLTDEKTKVKISSATIGKIVDLNQTDVNNMGAVMAPAAADTLYRHLLENNETVNDYDLILTGDLGIYGKEILRDYMKEMYKIELKDNYNDCGAMLYDFNKTEEVTAGGSGPVCSALINYSYIYEQLKAKKLKKVLLLPTGALFSPTIAYQKQPILSICHAVCLESVLWPIYIHFYLLEHYV